MSGIIKQISVYDGSSWGTSNIGVDAANVLLSSNIAGSTNLQTALGNILPASQLSTANQVLIADSNKRLATSGVSATQLGYLSGVTSGIQTQINTLNSNLTTLNTNKLNKAVTSDTTVTAITAASGCTVNALQFLYNDKIAQLHLSINHSSAWTVNNEYIVGTLSYPSLRPIEASPGSSKDCFAWIDENGVIHVFTTVNRAANNNQYFRFGCYFRNN